MGRALIPCTLHLDSKTGDEIPKPGREGRLCEKEDGGEPAALPGDWPSSSETQTQQNVIRISRFCAKKL